MLPSPDMLSTCFLYIALQVASVYIVLQYSGQGMGFLGHPTSTCVSVLSPETWHVNELGNWAGERKRYHLGSKRSLIQSGTVMPNTGFATKPLTDTQSQYRGLDKRCALHAHTNRARPRARASAPAAELSIARTLQVVAERYHMLCHHLARGADLLTDVLLAGS